MKVTVTISRTHETKDIQLKPRSTVIDLLKKINLKPDTLIVMNNNTPVPIDDVLTDGQDLTILQVSSGG
jgi:sulfur carrier protein ThiS